MIGNDGNSTDQLPADSYHQYQMESMQQPAQPKHDDYYTVSPGENYYTEYSGVDDNQDYSACRNYDNSHEPTTAAAVVTEQNNLQDEQQTDYLVTNEQIADAYIPNYLQSDTDDSQTGYRNDTTNKTPQNHDSDFDFSTNSDAN